MRRGELGSPLRIVVSSVVCNALWLPLRTTAIGVEFRAAIAGDACSGNSAVVPGLCAAGV
jgi:branched-subunit amino acid ABC-type transport system permease component